MKVTLSYNLKTCDERYIQVTFPLCLNPILRTTKKYCALHDTFPVIVYGEIIGLELAEVLPNSNSKSPSFKGNQKAA